MSSEASSSQTPPDKNNNTSSETSESSITSRQSVRFVARQQQIDVEFAANVNQLQNLVKNNNNITQLAAESSPDQHLEEQKGKMERRQSIRSSPKKQNVKNNLEIMEEKKSNRRKRRQSQLVPNTLNNKFFLQENEQSLKKLSKSVKKQDSTLRNDMAIIRSFTQNHLALKTSQTDPH